MSEINPLKLANTFPGEWRKRQNELNQKTLRYYENLTQTKRNEILDWLRKNLSSLHVPVGLKTTGFEKLWEGKHQYPASLLLVRQAVKKLEPENYNLFI